MLALLSLLLSATALAGPPPQHAGNRVEAVNNRQDARDDAQDFGAIVRIVDDWHAARAASDRPAENAADARIRAWLRREIDEARTEVAEANREVHRSAAEAQRSDARRGSTPLTGAAARAADDDRRDLADDRADRRSEVRDLEGLRAIAVQLREIQPRIESGTAIPNDYARKSELLRELQRSARGENRENHAERAEDQHERAEDR